MTQLPTLAKVTVLPETEQAFPVVDGSTEKVTGRPALLRASTWYSSPTVGSGAVDVKAMVCAALATWSVWVALAEARSASPAWVAVTTQSSAWTKVTVPPESEHACVGASVTHGPEVLVAPTS